MPSTRSFIPTADWTRASDFSFDQQLEDAQHALTFPSMLDQGLEQIQAVASAPLPEPQTRRMPMQTSVDLDPVPAMAPHRDTDGSVYGGEPQQPESTTLTFPSSPPTGGTPVPMPTGQTAASPPSPPAGGAIDNSSRQAFITSAWPHVLEAAKGDRNLAEMMLAKAISENGDVGTGKDLSATGFNFSGIKGKGTAGSFTSPTWEQVNGQRVNITDEFASYRTPQEGFGAFMGFLEENPRYHRALAAYRESGDAAQLFRDVNMAGYATDPQWASKVENIRANQVAPIVAGTQTPAPSSTQRAAEGRNLAGETRLQGITPPQFGLGDADAESICGPVLAMAFAQANGRPATIAEAKQMAAQHGGWTSADGMGGPEAMAQTLRAMRIPAHYAPGPLDVETIRTETANGNPVGINTRGHYFVVEGVDEQGRLDLGNSAKALKASGGRQWFKPEEIAALGMGAPTGAIYKDSPSSPTPSVAVQATGMPPVSARLPLTAGSTPADSPLVPPVAAAPASQPVAGVSDLDAARAQSGSGQGLNMKAEQPGTADPIQNADGSVTTERSITVTDPRLNGGRATNIPTVWSGRIVSDDEAVQHAAASGMTWPSFDSIPEAVQAAEQRSQDLGAGRATSVGGATVPPEVQNALPNRNRPVRGGPVDERQGMQSDAPMLRQPLSAQPELPADTSAPPVRDDWRTEAPLDPDQGPHELIPPGAVSAPPIISPLAPQSNPGVSTTAALPAPPQIQITQGGPPTPSAQFTEMPTQPTPQPAAPEPTAPSGMLPVYDLAGTITGYVRQAAEGITNAAQGAVNQIGANMAGNRQAVEDAYAVPTEQRPPQYSGSSYAPQPLPKGQRPYFAPTETETAAFGQGIEDARAAAPVDQIPIPFTGASIPVPERLQRPVGAAAGALGALNAADQAVRARIDPRVWGFAHDGIRRELFTPEQLAREAYLRGTMDPETGARHTVLTQAEQDELATMDAAVEQRYQQIKNDPDALTRYANASPAYGPTSGLTDIALTPALGAAAGGTATRGAEALGASARTARGVGYAADIAAQTVVDPTTPLTQGPLDAAVAGVRGAVGAARRLPGQNPVSAAPAPAGFQTARGSTYDLLPDGTTIRTKAARDDPGHVGDVGLQPKSDATFFLAPEDAPRLGMPQGPSRIVDHGDGTLSVATQNADGRWGIAPSQRAVPYETAPRVGSVPLEVWRREEIYGLPTYGDTHFGNPIVRVDAAPPAPALSNAQRVAAADAPGVQYLGSGFVPEGQSWEDISRQLPEPTKPTPPQRPPDDRLIREQYGRPWEEVAPTGPSAIGRIGEATDQMVTEGRNLRGPANRVRPDERELIGGPVQIEPQSINLNAGFRPSRATAFNAAQGGVLGAASEDLQAQEEGREPDPTSRLWRGVVGAGLGIAAGRHAGRVAEGRLGSGVVPSHLPVDPAKVAAAAAEGPTRGAQLNRRLDPPGASIPLRVRAANAWTDDQAILRWAEDTLTQEAGRGTLPENAPERASTLRRRNPDSYTDQRIRDELAPVVARGRKEGLLDELTQYLQDTHERDVLSEFYTRGHEEALAAGKSAADADTEGIARMRRRASANADLDWETVNARLEGQQQRLGAKFDTLDELAQGVWDHNRTTLDRMLESGRISKEQHAWLSETYPHYVPTVPISHLDPGGGKVAVGQGSGISAGRSGPGDIKAFEDVASGSDRLNPIIASRDATIARERVAQKNEAFQAFARMYDDAQQMGSPTASPSQGARRQRFAGEVEVSGRVDGQPTTIRVPKPVAEAIDAMSEMGAGDRMPAIWRAAMSAVTTSITGRRAAFLPVNLARDFGDSLIRAGSTYGPQAIPEFLGRWFAQAGNAAADLAVGAARGRLDVTGDATTYLRRGGGMGRAEGGWQKGEQWYDDVQRTGGVVFTDPKAFGNVMRDLATFKPVMAANERTELISRTAMMQMAEKRGAGPTEAMIAGRDASVDFNRAGTLARMLNSGIPFFNATVQGGAQLVRTLRDHPKSAAATLATVVGLPVAAAEAYNRSDPQRAHAYDDVPQYLKDQGIVVMMPWAGSDNRGERPNYLWLPLGMGAPVAVAMREAMREAPGLEPASGRSNLPSDASDLQGWASVAEQVFGMLSPIKGESAAGAASSLIPPGAKQLVELGTNKNLYTGGTIASDTADERASAFGHGVADAANSAGRTIGSDLLQEVRPSHVDYLTRQLPAYGDVVSGVSDMVAPSGYKQAEDRPVANAPVVGGPASRIIRDTGGADIERARNDMLSETVRDALSDAGMRPSDIQAVPNYLSIEGQQIPLMRDEQTTYQERTNSYADREISTTMRSGEWRARGADREKLIKDAMARARDRAEQDVLRRIPSSEQRRRVRESEAMAAR